MTPFQQRALDFVRHRITEVGHAPLRREIADHLRISDSGATDVIRSLEQLGKLRRTNAGSRNLELADQPDLRMAGSSALRAELMRRGEILEGLGAPRGLAPGTTKHCAADSCGASVPIGHLFCRAHWWKLPARLQDDIKDAHARRDRRRYQSAIAEARDIADGGKSWRRT